jgi:aminoglycoside 2''-phosphotransferase
VSNILSVVNNPAFQRQVEVAINSHIKTVSEIDFVEHGDDNLVTIVNKELVFRFPRSELKARRIAFETAIFQKTKGKITAVQIPELVEVHTSPLYIVAKYIPGEHYSAAQIKELHEEDQQKIGATVADFIYQFNQAISGLEVRRLRTESGVDALQEPWQEYLARLFEQQRLPNDKLRVVVDEYYPLWKDFSHQEQSNYAIHDDLHLSNLLFSGEKLTGVVDFGDVNTGSIESELRWLYTMGDIVLQSAVSHFEALSGARLNYDHIRVWAIMHELSTFTDRLAKQQTEVYPFLRAQQNLRTWIPNFPL